MTTTFTFDVSLVSDLHKDAYGFRPRGAYWDQWHAMTEAERQVEWDRLLKTAQDSAADEERALNVAEAEADALFINLRAATGGSVADVVRYLHDQNDTDGDDEYLDWHLGVRYGYIRRKLAGE